MWLLARSNAQVRSDSMIFISLVWDFKVRVNKNKTLKKNSLVFCEKSLQPPPFESFPSPFICEGSSRRDV